MVMAAEAIKLIEFARFHVNIPKAQLAASWQNLIECMTSTHNHAGYNASESRVSNKPDPLEKWTAGVMINNGVAYFAFVDLGVGICGSREAKSWIATMKDRLISYRPEDVVKDAFDGKLGSRTRHKGRGLGLPRMKHASEQGLLQNLHVRTGQVEGDIASMRFRNVGEDLHGTVLTWTASEKKGIRYENSSNG